MKRWIGIGIIIISLLLPIAAFVLTDDLVTTFRSMVGMVIGLGIGGKLIREAANDIAKDTEQTHDIEHRGTP